MSIIVTKNGIKLYPSGWLMMLLIDYGYNRYVGYPP